MTRREWMLTLALVAASACIVRGIALLSEPAAWIVAGPLIAAVAYLTLAGEDVPEAPDEAVE